MRFALDVKKEELLKRTRTLAYWETSPLCHALIYVLSPNWHGNFSNLLKIEVLLSCYSNSNTLSNEVCEDATTNDCSETIDFEEKSFFSLFFLLLVWRLLQDLRKVCNWNKAFQLQDLTFLFAQYLHFYNSCDSIAQNYSAYDRWCDNTDVVVNIRRLRF